MQWLSCSECGRIVRGDHTRSRECSECSVPLIATTDVGGGVVLASRLFRLAGYFADQALVGLLMAPALYAAGVLEASGRRGADVFLSAFMWVGIASALYFIVPTAIWGQTPGKWFAGTRVVGPDGAVPGWKRATMRGIVSATADLLFNTCLVGVLDPMWLLWDPNRQTLHDKAAGTVVVPARRRKPAMTLVVSLLLAVGLQAGLVFAFIRPFIVQAYYVPSGSMHPTLVEHDRLIVNKLSYRYGELRRGDVIVFTAPKAALLSNPAANPDPNEKKDFIKRLIALPGDTVKVEGGRLWIKTRAEEKLHTIEEAYLAGMRMDYEWGPVTVPEGHAIVLGDNRNNSNDSSRWGAEDEPNPFLPIENIRGRAFGRYWPIRRWGALPRSEPITAHVPR